jgi:uncharacterized protein (DUF302 family)
MDMMKMMVNSFSRPKREEMMMNMMPLMMEGIDMHEFMPKMMAAMLKDLSADDIIGFIKEAFGDKETAKKILNNVQEANLMQRMMFMTFTSKFGFDETVEKLRENGIKSGWEIPDIRDLQEEYRRAGLNDMTKMKVLYFCNPLGGYSIVKDDGKKPMSVMMPTGVSVYEKAGGRVEIAAMNLGMMSSLMPEGIQEVLKDGGERLEKSLEGIVD